MWRSGRTKCGTSPLLKAPWAGILWTCPLGLSFEEFSKEVHAQGEDNVYGAMQKARSILTHPKASKIQKIEALKFLVHFVGDAHQPMHVSRKEDKGGNTIQVRFDNQGTNLHSLWDSKLLDHQG
jgi:hypothetical protein